MGVVEVEVCWDFGSVNIGRKGIIMMDVFTEDAEICTSVLQTRLILM